MEQIRFNGPVRSISLRRTRRQTLSVAAALSLVAPALRAASIPVPNSSFESQSGVGQPQGVNINIDSWQKGPKPAYFDAIEQGFGIFWTQTAGVFVDPGQYANRIGDQAAYMLSFAQVSLSQELASPFTAGMSYQFTLGVNGKTMTEGSTLQLSMYYRDGLDNAVTVGTPATIAYTAAGFPAGFPLNLTDFSASTAIVQPGDAWAGKSIGLRIESTGDGTGYWDMDNARVTSVPEPGAATLLLLGLGGLFISTRRRRS